MAYVLSPFSRAFTSSPRVEQKIHRAEPPVVRGGVEQRPLVRLVAHVQLVGVLRRAARQASPTSPLRAASKSWPSIGQRIDVRLERAPAREAVLLREVELRVGELRVGFVDAELIEPPLRLLAKPVEIRVVRQRQRRTRTRGWSDMCTSIPSKRHEPFHDARCPQLGRGIEGECENGLGWVEPFTRTVGRPCGAGGTLCRSLEHDK